MVKTATLFQETRKTGSLTTTKKAVWEVTHTAFLHLQKSVEPFTIFTLN